MTTTVLYNPYANNNRAAEQAKKLQEVLPEDKLEFLDLTTLEDVPAYVMSRPEDERIILAGGDGTLNRFVNDLGDRPLTRPLDYYPAGSGNDFMTDIKDKEPGPIVRLNPHLEQLPTVTVNGKIYRFLNGIGYGIDGYCCEVGDKLKATSDKPVNYAGIAIKGLLFHYHPTQATVIADGVEHTFRKVWLAPTMHGRYYGGGMMVAPDQDRSQCGGVSTTVVMYGSGKLKTLMVFPGIFKGEHIRHREMVSVLTGREITVRFDRPTALQIDGETVLGVTEYSVHAPAPLAAPSEVPAQDAIPV